MQLVRRRLPAVDMPGSKAMPVEALASLSVAGRKVTGPTTVSLPPTLELELELELELRFPRRAAIEVEELSSSNITPPESDRAIPVRSVIVGTGSLAELRVSGAGDGQLLQRGAAMRESNKDSSRVPYRVRFAGGSPRPWSSLAYSVGIRCTGALYDMAPVPNPFPNPGPAHGYCKTKQQLEKGEIIYYQIQIVSCCKQQVTVI